MYFVLLTFILSIVSTIDGQSCQSTFNRSIIGQCSSIDSCEGTILASYLCERQICCINTTLPSISGTCITGDDLGILKNTSRAKFLRSALNYGINSAGICGNCQAKAAFLAVAATMTENFTIDEVVKSDAEFSADDKKYGNSKEGDGSQFRRRGFFGVRGRTMYERLAKLMSQNEILTNPEIVALTNNAIEIASLIWKNPNLLNESTLTKYADGTFYGFSMLWYKLTEEIAQLAVAAKYYSIFLRQLECGGDLYSGQGPVCKYNETHNGLCSPDCIKGLEDSSTFCGCSGPKGPECPNSPKHIRCCLDSCSQELKMDLGIVLDASGSVGQSNYLLQLNFTKNLLRRVNVGLNKTHVGIINYSDIAKTLTSLNKDHGLDEKLQRVDEAIYYSSGTDTARALVEANIVFSYENGRRLSYEGVTPVIFVITDGQSNTPAETIRAASILKRNDIILVSVGVGNQPDLDELHAICSPPASENYFAVSNYGAFEQKLNQFTSKSCAEPAPVPSNITVMIEIMKDKYKFLKVEITTIGNKILVTITLFNGNVKLFYSFTNRNPKDPADFIDYETETKDDDSSLWMRIKSYFWPSSTKTNRASNGEIRLVLEKPDTNVEFAYIGIKGIEEDNQFKLKFDDCAESTLNLGPILHHKHNVTAKSTSNEPTYISSNSSAFEREND
ncbi:unnamed protein product [Rotaria socialis]|uniref:VWFA domain-containing protein n=1 Tax=Rotaria socialis TaxID=392032 RepID=A0A817PWF7_9BILA|nr:unnamed protein product [Rotaria socialis]CAF3183316.1 unnamed protein product [Rotaria socialis]CAF4212314.1 unnamed protein product [Rotaria socialis]CAF4322957.1 unnamed protein product [Rotaria socialis]CAF4561434.1 unnamed protein product [Rotaria socialis]